jgi:hypothetical protein
MNKKHKIGCKTQNQLELNFTEWKLLNPHAVIIYTHSFFENEEYWIMIIYNDFNSPIYLG